MAREGYLQGPAWRKPVGVVMKKLGWLKNVKGVDMITRKLEQVAVSATRAATRVLWPLVKKWNAAFERESIRAKWAPAPLLKSRERSFPPLGWPRTTDSLCPRCVKETREAILDGTRSFGELIVGKPGEIQADIVEEN